MRYLKRTVAVGLLAALLVSSFSGCNYQSSAEGVKSIKALSLEEISANKAQILSSAERENLVYSYVSNNVNIDLTKLVQAQGTEITDITKLVSDINSRLRGQEVTGNTEDYEPISDEFLNYMLMKFTKTPYSWKYDSMKVQGFDAATRLFFVDVTYKTDSSSTKEILPDSLIVKGEPDEDAKLKKRYQDYIDCLKLAQSAEKDNASKVMYNEAVAKFESTWGTFDEVLDSQQSLSFTERLAMKNAESKSSRSSTVPTDKNKTNKTEPSANMESTKGSEDIGVLIYKSESENKNTATVTYRMVMGYNYSLGQAINLSLKSLYLYDYSIDGIDDFISKSSSNAEISGKEVIEPLLTSFFTSYNRCVDETNHIGLYSLFDQYKSSDKYYTDYNRYTYHTFGAFQYKILSQDKDTINVLVTSQNKERAKGAYMSQPTYKQRDLFKIRLGNDDKLHLVSVVNLDMVLTGEPISVVQNVAGVSEQLLFSEESFSDTNKADVEKKLKDFEEVVLLHSLNSDAFSTVVDLGISQSQLSSMQKSIESIDADEMLSYIVSYNTKSSVYVSVDVREIFFKDKKGYDTTATIDLVHRNDGWYIISYTRKQNVEVKRTNIDDTTSFMHIKKDGSGVKDIKTKQVTVVSEGNNSVSSAEENSK